MTFLVSLAIRALIFSKSQMLIGGEQYTAPGYHVRKMDAFKYA